MLKENRVWALNRKFQFWNEEMKNILLLIAILSALSVVGQRKISPTDTLKILGKIKNEKTFTLIDLDTFPQKNIADVVITDQQWEIKRTIKNLKGILLKNVLEKIELQVENHKVLNECYFIFVASDGYKVVFSWNEIFNTDTGNNLFIITEMGGKKIKEMDERILFISTKDLITGRRYIKGLQKIIVQRVD